MRNCIALSFLVLAFARGLGATESTETANSDETKHPDALSQQKEADDLASKTRALADAHASVAAQNKRIEIREKDAAKIKEVVATLTLRKAAMTAAAKRLDDANAKVAKQRRRASAASMKEQEDAQKAYNEMKRDTPSDDLDAQLTAAEQRRIAIAKDLETMEQRLAEAKGRCAEAEKAVEAAAHQPAPSGTDVAPSGK